MNNVIGTASFNIAVYSVDSFTYTDRETKEQRTLNRAITDQGIVYVNDEIAALLSSADLLHPVQLSARVNFKDGKPVYYFEKVNKSK